MNSLSDFEASAFHPDLPGGRGPGTIRIEQGRLRFTPREGGELVIRMPFRSLDIRLGGASDRILFFSHPDHPEVSIYTSDHAILEHPALAAQAGVAEQVRKVKGRKLYLRLALAATVAALVLGLLSLVLLKDPLVGLVADRVPASVEVELGKTVFNQIRGTTRLIEDAELSALLGELVAPLMSSIPDTGYPFELHLAEDSTLNAFALPGGHVVLHSGLVLEAESAEEVLGVLGHEIAHVTRRHSLRQLISSAGVFMLFQAFFGDLTGVAALLADGGMQLLTLEFSRDHERDADDTGFDYLVDAGIDPRGMITFFEKLQAEHEEMLGGAAGLETKLSFLSTHPATEERIEYLESRLSVLGTPAHIAPQTFDFRAFQDKLRSHITLSSDE